MVTFFLEFARKESNYKANTKAQDLHRQRGLALSRQNLDSSPSAETLQLKSLGYQQELDRRMSAFSNFALSFSIICILAGGITSFPIGFSSVGGAAIGLGWPLACCFSLVVAACMGQLASAFPTAGGLYHWAAILGGRFWGWVTAWFNLAGLITVLAAINVGMFLFFLNTLRFLFGTELFASLSALWVQAIGVGVLTFLQALINHRGIRLTTRLTDLSGYAILLISVVLSISLLLHVETWEWSRLWQFQNFSGETGGNVWPHSDSLAYLFLVGLLLPAYTITGFDASAHTAEETIDAARHAPRGIVQSVWVSGLAGWVLLGSMVLAMPDLTTAAQQGFDVFFWLLRERLPFSLSAVLLIGICLVQWLCGLATVTSASRMMYAFARDGGLPFSRGLSQVHEQSKVPHRAIWTVACLAWAFTLYTPLYSTITVVCSSFLYISYVLPLLLGAYAYRRTWTQLGPWSLGSWFRPACLLAVLGCGVLLWIGIQPPNEKALPILVGTFVLMLVVWFGLERRRFRGPPLRS